MSTITQSVDVAVGLRSVYDQWTQFASFPEFMDGVDEVRQVDDVHLRWKISVGPVSREFDATITDQQPDRLVSWRSDDGPQHDGTITFEPIDGDHTRVTAHMTIDPEGLVEKVGDASGLLEARIEGDLLRFKDFIEARDGHETGAWRGDV
ncbi:SRPBCC family protein [Aeromicrobium sp. CF4.19]|uniref:SRPBCC family protein n=1 Tax=Aeromicrobium sp. CF4.19 TaxID=3373082 RepID=UPI003EE73C96